MPSERALLLAAAVLVLAVWVWYARRPAPREAFTQADLAAINTGVPSLMQTYLAARKALFAYRKVAQVYYDKAKAKDPLQPARRVEVAKAKAVVASSHAASDVQFAAAMAMQGQAVKGMYETAKKVRDHYDVVLKHAAAAAAATTAEAAEKAAADAETARQKCQAQLIDAMNLRSPPRQVALPPRTTDIQHGCQGFNDDSGWTISDPHRPYSPEHKKLLDFLTTRGREFLAHMLAKYPADPRTLTLNKHWSRQIVGYSERGDQLEGAWAKMYGPLYNKCIAYNMILNNSVPRSLTRMLHEMSHIAADPDGQEGHTPRFYETQRWFLGIATRELGWVVENWCRETCDVPKGREASACTTCGWVMKPEECQASEAECRPKDEKIETTTREEKTTADVPKLKAMAPRYADKATEVYRLAQKSLPKNDPLLKQLETLAASAQAGAKLAAANTALMELDAGYTMAMFSQSAAVKFIEANTSIKVDKVSTAVSKTDAAGGAPVIPVVPAAAGDSKPSKPSKPAKPAKPAKPSKKKK